MATTDEQVLEHLEQLQHQADEDARQLAAGLAAYLAMTGAKAFKNIGRGIQMLVEGAQVDAAMTGLAAAAWRRGDREEAMQFLTPAKSRH